jgi:streptogramin lyase
MNAQLFFFDFFRGQPRRRHAGGIAFVVTGGLALVAALSGCGGVSSMSAASEGGVAMQGQVRGGQQPVVGASIELYAAGATGGGVGAVNLLALHVVTTDNQGGFNISGDYVCPTAGTQVYLVARGGNPGLGSNTGNAALAMMTALGNCGDLTSSTRVQITEATTVAAVWALEQFMSSGGNVGAVSTNSSGLANAFAVAKNLADTAAGTAPGPALPTGATSETAKLYALADVLAVCVNSDGGSACGPLFTAATTSSGVPSNTLDAALNIVTHPGSNVAEVFSAGSALGPFQPTLAKVPNDWTMSITYGGCTPACGGLNLPGAVAVDSAGNVMVADYFGGVFSKFSPSGVPASTTGISGTGLRESFGIAVDASDNVWVTNEQSVTGANNQHGGSISKFSPDGVELSGYGYTGGGVYYPVAVATDSGGDVWVADHGSSSASLLANDGSAISGGSGYGASGLTFTSSVALDASRNAWFAVQGAAVRVNPSGGVSSFSCCSDPAGIAIDRNGNVWIADNNASAVVELASTGAVIHTTSVLGGNGGPKGIAVDGAGNVWAANFFGDALVELAGSTAVETSPAQGYGQDANLSEPYGLAIDASGNVWVSNVYTNTLTQFVGLAVPVKTPLLGPAAQP